MIERERVESLLRGALPAVAFDAGLPLLHAGLSSLDIIVIVSEAYGAFGVWIPPEELKAANFESLDSIYRLIQKYEKDG